MTKKQLKQCFTLRKELALIDRQLAAGGENARETARLKERAETLVTEIDAVLDYIDSLEESLARQMVMLHFYEGLTIKETAAAVGYSDRHCGVLLRTICPQ